MEEIINNVMQSPENTNPNVLRSQLQSIGGGSGGGGENIELHSISGSANIEANISMNELINALLKGAKLYYISDMGDMLYTTTFILSSIIELKATGEKMIIITQFVNGKTPVALQGTEENGKVVFTSAS